MRGLIGLALCTGLVAAADPPADQVKKELEKFQGTWKPEKVEFNGEPPPGNLVETMSLVIEGNKLTLKGGGRSEDTTFDIDPTKKPATIDVTHKQKSETAMGIYKFDGEKLTMCWAEPKAEARPTEFESKKGAKMVLMVLTKAK
jgi:uncharacterized protein (TIGR03067 family)